LSELRPDKTPPAPERKALKGIEMNLINFIVWLSAGAVIGWFASRMVQMEYKPASRPVSS